MIAGIACLFIAEPTRQLPKPLGDSGSIGVGRLLMVSESAAPVKLCGWITNYPKGTGQATLAHGELERLSLARATTMTLVRL